MKKKRSYINENHLSTVSSKGGLGFRLYWRIGCRLAATKQFPEAHGEHVPKAWRNSFVENPVREASVFELELLHETVELPGGLQHDFLGCSRDGLGTEIPVKDRPGNLVAIWPRLEGLFEVCSSPGGASRRSLDISFHLIFSLYSNKVTLQV